MSPRTPIPAESTPAADMAGECDETPTRTTTTNSHLSTGGLISAENLPGVIARMAATTNSGFRGLQALRSGYVCHYKCEIRYQVSTQIKQPDPATFPRQLPKDAEHWLSIPKGAISNSPSV
jgi:hypothetical protein